jgi:glycosyltransferase involved in cell wall biosynthesis
MSPAELVVDGRPRATAPPAISVVIPCYQAEEHLAGTVASVLAQTRSDWEIVMVDDGSSDGTLALATSLVDSPHPISVVTQANGGAPAARNTGMRFVSDASRHVLFLDADDLLEPEMLEMTVGHLDAHPEVGLVHTGWNYIDDAGRPVQLDPPRLLPRWAPARGCASSRRTSW